MSEMDSHWSQKWDFNGVRQRILLVSEVGGLIDVRSLI